MVHFWCYLYVMKYLVTLRYSMICFLDNASFEIAAIRHVKLSRVNGKLEFFSHNFSIIECVPRM